MPSALGAGSWGIGQAAWSYLELLSGRETPFPSVADAAWITETLAAHQLWVSELTPLAPDLESVFLQVTAAPDDDLGDDEHRLGVGAR